MVSKDETADDVRAVDVVVVGAGISGLAVATSLIEGGKSVAVIEARDQIGGRLRSANGGDGTIDMGATWFWPGEERVERLNQQLELEIHDQHIDGDMMFHDGSSVQRVEGNPIDVPAFRWSGGAAILPEAVAARLPDGTVQLSEAVRALDFGGDDVLATSSAGTYRAGDVVMALPPALAVARIDISPALPPSFADLARTTPVWMGAMTKVVAVYGNAFWRDRGLAGAAFSHRGPLREMHDMSGPDGQPAALFGFVPGAEPGGPSADAVIAQLVEMYGEDAADPLAVHVMDWRAEEWTSPADVERHVHHQQTYGHPIYAQPMYGGRLHWCSTETATVAPGHVEGALMAAERTTKAILDEAD